MQRHRALLLGVMALFVATACSRLTFVRQSAQRQGAEEVAPEYHVRDSAATKKRLATHDQLMLAAQRLRAGDLASAERAATAVLKASPESADAHTLLAVINERQGNNVQAGSHYKQAAELAPGQGAGLNNYGAWLCQNGSPAESLVWFDRALADPRYASPSSALANAGGCALKSGQYERAERDLRRALELEPSNAYALASMAENEFRQKRFFAARAFSERRLSAASASPAVLQLAIEIEERLGDKAAASRYVQRLRTEFPDVATANPGGVARP